MGAHRFAGFFRIAMLNRLKNAFVMKLSAVRAARHLENAQALLAKKTDDRIQKRENQGIVRALGSRENLLILMIDGDVGKTFGHLLQDELGFSGKLISIDGVHLHDLDFVDVGELYEPPGVVPVVIKSLLFRE